MRKTILFLSLLVPVCIYAQLDLDLSYGDQGINNTGLPGNNVYSSGINGISNAPYFMPDNSVLIPYSLHPYFSLQFPNLEPTIGIKKYLENGAPDTTFGTNGTALFTATYHGSRFEVNGVGVQPDGKILLVGRSHSIGGFSYDYGSFLCRFNANGTQDTTFGNNGLVYLNMYVENSADTNDERFTDVAVDDQGRIIAVGYTYWYLGSSVYDASAKAVRFLADGTLDTTFAANGFLEVNAAGQDSFSNIYPTGDGHFILLGATNPTLTQSDLLVAKIDSEGRFVTTFGTGGMTQIGFGGNTVAVKAFFRPQSKIMVAGLKIGTGLAFAKLNADGSLDTTFSEDGKNTTVILVPGHDRIGSEGYPGISSDHIALLPDNKFILVSTVRTSNTYDYSIARLNEDTTLDTTFMTNGVYTGGATPSFDWARGLHVQSDGKLIVLVNSILYKYANFSVLGLTEINSNNRPEIYPNPTNGIVHLGSLAHKATVKDLTGKILADYNQVEKIDLSDAVQGIYFISITHENGLKEVKKIIKQ